MTFRAAALKMFHQCALKLLFRVHNKSLKKLDGYRLFDQGLKSEKMRPGGGETSLIFGVLFILSLCVRSSASGAI